MCEQLRVRLRSKSVCCRIVLACAPRRVRDTYYFRRCTRDGRVNQQTWICGLVQRSRPLLTSTYVTQALCSTFPRPVLIARAARLLVRRGGGTNHVPLQPRRGY